MSDPSVISSQRLAATSSAGFCCSTVLFSLGTKELRKEDGDALRMRVAYLLRLLDAGDQDDPLYRPGNLHLLVAVSRRVLNGNAEPKQFEVFPEELRASPQSPVMLRGDGQADVLVQIAAPTETDRRYGLRLAVEVIARGFGTDGGNALDVRRREIHGAKIFSGLEPFGYRDATGDARDRFPPEVVKSANAGGKAILERLTAEANHALHSAEQSASKGSTAPSPERQANRLEQRLQRFEKILNGIRRDPDAATLPTKLSALRDERAEATAAEFGQWLLFQRFVHDFTNFNPATTERAIGKEPFAADGAPAGAHSHLAIAHQDRAAFRRRGFPYRNDRGEEGIAFIALANEPEVHHRILLRHLGQDPLFELTRAIDSGIYFVPTSWEELLPLELSARGALSVPPIAAQLLRPRSSPIPQLVNYQLAPQLMDYIQLARAEGMFLEPTMQLRPDIEALLVQIEDALGIGPDLRVLREQIRQTSEAVYELNGGYLTLGA